MGFGASTPKAVKAPVAPPIEQDVSPEVTAARDKLRRTAMATFGGRGSTILTSAQGVQGPASIGLRTLLGG